MSKHVSKQVDVYQGKYDLKTILRPTEILTPSLQSNAPLQPTLTSEPSFEEGRQEVFPTEQKKKDCLSSYCPDSENKTGADTMKSFKATKILRQKYSQSAFHNNTLDSIFGQSPSFSTKSQL